MKIVMFLGLFACLFCTAVKADKGKEGKLF